MAEIDLNFSPGSEKAAGSLQGPGEDLGGRMAGDVPRDNCFIYCKY